MLCPVKTQLTVVHSQLILKMAIKPRVNLQNLIEVLTKQCFRDLSQIQDINLSVTLKCTQEFVLVTF